MMGLVFWQHGRTGNTYRNSDGQTAWEMSDVKTKGTEDNIKTELGKLDCEKERCMEEA
jgi:hypothetical protein